ncbi:MAG: hypothetical protein ABSF59_07525 [Candidatus Sulfotelmatobacter sp.]|jgi:hypothetical protein
MKIGALLASLLALAAPDPSRPALSNFTNMREIKVEQPNQQNFFIVDQELWTHSRPDLGDIRVYDGDGPVQYYLSEQRAEISSEEVDAKILNLGTVSGHTEFDLDAENIPAYDRIRLRLEAKDFVISASAAGSNALGHEPYSQLPASTLYDFTSEQLGSNFALKLPPSSFRYLHIKLSKGILPSQVKGAAISNRREQQASWTTAGSCSPLQQKPRDTVIACDVPAKVPLNRILFQIAPGQINFRRKVVVQNAKGEEEAQGEISRVKINRAGALVTAEDLAIPVSGSGGAIVLNIDNEDNPPLEITAVQPLSLERRIYFDPQGKSSLKLYYGDQKLSPPVYDYARFFHLDPSPAAAQLEAVAHNPLYMARPDDRPWSERHTGILWGAMILAVLALTALAIRGLRSEAKP